MRPQASAVAGWFEQRVPNGVRTLRERLNRAERSVDSDCDNGMFPGAHVAGNDDHREITDMLQFFVPVAGIPPLLAENRMLPGESHSVPGVVIASMLLAAAVLQRLVRASARDDNEVGSAPVPAKSALVLFTGPGAAVFTALIALTVATTVLFGAPAAVILSVVATLPGGLVVGNIIARRDCQVAQGQSYLGRLAHSGRLITTAPSTELAATLTDAAIDFGFDVACLLLLDEDDKRFTVCGAAGFAEDFVGTTVYASEGILGMEAAARVARRVIVADDYAASPFNNPNLASAFRCALAAPLSVGGRPIGVLAAAKRSSGFTAEQVEAFEVLALQGGLGFETVARRRAALEAAVL